MSPDMSPRIARSPRIAGRVLAAIVVLLIGIWLGGHPSWLPSPLRGAFVDDGNGRFVSEVLKIIERDYYRPVNGRQLVNKGLQAAVASLDDPYSRYLDAADYRASQNQTNPHFSGIGIDVASELRGLRIVEVFGGSPAAHAGLTPGELIVAVDQTSLTNRSAASATQLITGRSGTRVSVTVLSGKAKHVVSLVRARLVSPVASEKVVTFHGVKIGNLRLALFADGAGDELRAQVDSALHSGARALVLDLRENPGGLLAQAVDVASIFIANGTIVSTAGRNQPRQVYVAKGGAISASIPLVVLVDRGSASSAEIVTGALQDRHRAKVVGTRTYGKGVFQQVEPLSNGGALDITVGEYFTPSGRNLGGAGVTRGTGIPPDVFALSNPHARRDSALLAAQRTVAAEVR
ncbi:MAG: S41 family peptidase [Solirubrobacteraceae bacterium]